jgi:hypothetical protein
MNLKQKKDVKKKGSHEAHQDRSRVVVAHGRRPGLA